MSRGTHNSPVLTMVRAVSCEDPAARPLHDAMATVSHTEVSEALLEESQVAAMAVEGVEDEGEASQECPLFMTGLPTDFSSNPQLAAIASLLDEGEANATEKEATTAPRKAEIVSNAGGGKARRASTRSTRRGGSSPYSSASLHSTAASRSSPTTAEAQLFLQMWKLS